MRVLSKKILSAAVASVFCVTATQAVLANPELVYDFTPGVDSTSSIDIEVAGDKLKILAAETDVQEYAIGLDGEISQTVVDTSKFRHVAELNGKTYVATANKVYEENDSQGYTLIAEVSDFYGADMAIYYDIEQFYVEAGVLRLEFRVHDVGRSWDQTYYISKIINPETHELSEGERYPYGEPSADLPSISDADFYYYIGDGRAFVASTENTGQEFWTLKGAGVERKLVLLADLNAGAKNSYHSWELDFKGESYFTAVGDTGRELYKINSDVEIEKITDINPKGASFDYDGESMYANDDYIFFLAKSNADGYGLWRTDGTKQGTVLLKGAETGSFSFGNRSYDFERIANTQNGIVLKAVNDVTQEEMVLYSDGTAAGTVALPYPASSFALGYTQAKKVIDVGNGVLVIVEAKSSSSYAVSSYDINTGIITPYVEDVPNISIITESLDATKNSVAIRIYYGAEDYELVSFSGADSTFTRLGQFELIPTWYNTQSVLLDGKFFFFAQADSATGLELWTTDHTAAGTTLVKDINPLGDSLVWNYNSEVVGNHYYFQAYDATNGEQMWVTDGTEAGTHMFDPISDEFTVDPASFVEFNGKVYFASDSTDYGKELFAYTPESNVTTPSPGTGALGDFVWEDTNADGIQDASELGLEGVTVQLQSCSGDFVASTTTDSMGAYRFDSVAEDHFQLQFILPSGYEFSPEKATSQYKLDSNANESTGVTPCYDMTEGYKRMAVDAGMVPVTTSTSGDGVMGDYVWEDTNADGIQNSSESGLQGITVNLQNCSGSEVATTITNSNGAYLFENIGNGDYRLEFELPAGFSFSPEKSTDQFKLDSNADETTGLTSCYNIDEGWKRRAIDAGMVPDGSSNTADTLTVVKAIYFSAENKLWVRASSDAEAGAAGLTASIDINGTTETLGNIGWNASKGFYQTNFKNLNGIPSTVTLTSELGGQVISDIELR